MGKIRRLTRRRLVLLLAVQWIASAALASLAEPPESPAAPPPASPAAPPDAPATRPAGGGAAPAAGAADQAIRDAFDRKLPEANFDHVALADGIDFLRDVTGLTIDVNWDALKAAGVYRETPVSARMADVKPLAALRAVLDAAGGKDRKAHLSVEKDRVVVTSLDEYVAHNTEERTYDIHDLLPPAPKDGDAKTRTSAVEDLTLLITDSVDPNSWSRAGGKPGTIKEKDGQFTITQTKENQQQIAGLLAQLREAKGRRNPQNSASRPAAAGPGK